VVWVSWWPNFIPAELIPLKGSSCEMVFASNLSQVAPFGHSAFLGGAAAAGTSSAAFACFAPSFFFEPSWSAFGPSAFTGSAWTKPVGSWEVG